MFDLVAVSEIVHAIKVGLGISISLCQGLSSC